MKATLLGAPQIIEFEIKKPARRQVFLKLKMSESEYGF